MRTGIRFEATGFSQDSDTAEEIQTIPGGFHTLAPPLGCEGRRGSYTRIPKYQSVLTSVSRSEWRSRWMGSVSIGLSGTGDP